jgi:hypothetical protein
MCKDTRKALSLKPKAADVETVIINGKIIMEKQEADNAEHRGCHGEAKRARSRLAEKLAANVK